jgi:hypothetical protein
MSTGLCSLGYAASGMLSNTPIPSVVTTLAEFRDDCGREFIKQLLYNGKFPLLFG